MKRLLAVLIVLSLLVLLLPAFGVANAKSPKPQDQVKNFMSAAAGLKASKAAGYWVAEGRSNLTSQLANVPSGTKISLAGLKLAVANQTADLAEVTATYVIKIKQGKAKAQQSSQKDTFNLKLVNGTWLISGTTMWDHLAGVITPSTSTTTPAAQTTTTATPTPTPTTSGNPVKIGGIMPWSGPAATSGLLTDQIIKLVEWQVKQQGGILGGRAIKVVRYDNRALVPEVQSGFRKLYYEEKVSAIVWGGLTVPERDAGSAMAEDLKILFIPLGEGSKLAELHYTVNASVQMKEYVETSVNIMTKLLNAKTAAFLAHEDKDSHMYMDILRPMLDAAGVKIVYEAYIPYDATDYTSYLTKIKYEHPDVLMADSNGNEFYMNIAKQMMELGGWGDIHVIGMPGAEQSRKLPGAQGWYMAANWAQGVDYPGATKFFNDFKTVNGGSANPSLIYMYNSLWTAIYAIELAGTDSDTAAIGQAARSGKLEWDSPSGHIHIMTDGTSGLTLIAEHVEGENLVYVPMPD